jgi:hypothetical protein
VYFLCEVMQNKMRLRGIDTGLPRTCVMYVHELLAVFTLLFSADIAEKNLDKNAPPPFHLLFMLSRYTKP